MLPRRLAWALGLLLSLAACTARADMQLTVAFTNFSAPFSFLLPGRVPAGYDIDLVRMLVDQMNSRLPVGQPNRTIVFLEEPSIDALLDSVTLNSTATAFADLAVSALAVLPSRSAVLFSTPYLSTGLQIMIIPKSTRESFGKALLSPLPLFLALVYTLGLFCFAHVQWLVERWRNQSDFRRSYIEGLGDGLWWAVTTSTTGSGSKEPHSLLGKIVAVFLIFFGSVTSALLVASLSAGLASAVLDVQISSTSDLAGRFVGILAGRASAAYARDNIAALFTVYADLAAAMAGLRGGAVDAIIDNSPSLLYAAAQDGSAPYAVVGSLFDLVKLAIAMPRDSPYASEVNDALGALQQSGALDALYSKWFALPRTGDVAGTRAHVSAALLRVTSWVAVFAVLGSALACAGIFAVRTVRQAERAAQPGASASPLRDDYDEWIDEPRDAPRPTGWAANDVLRSDSASAGVELLAWDARAGSGAAALAPNAADELAAVRRELAELKGLVVRLLANTARQA